MLAARGTPQLEAGQSAKREQRLADGAGGYISQTDPRAYPTLPANWRDEAAKGSYVWYGRDGRGERRVYSAAPIVGDEVFVILSAKSPSLFSWARLNPLTGLLEGFRWSLLGEGDLTRGTVLPAVIGPVLVMALGLFAFRRQERSFADVI